MTVPANSNLDDRLRGRTFGLVFVEKSAVRPDDLMLVLDAKMHRDQLPFVAGGPVHGPDVVQAAWLTVMEGRDFTTNVEQHTDSTLAIKLVQL